MCKHDYTYTPMFTLQKDEEQELYRILGLNGEAGDIVSYEEAAEVEVEGRKYVCYFDPDGDTQEVLPLEPQTCVVEAVAFKVEEEEADTETADADADADTEDSDEDEDDEDDEDEDAEDDTDDSAIGHIDTGSEHGVGQGLVDGQGQHDSDEGRASRHRTDSPDQTALARRTRQKR